MKTSRSAIEARRRALRAGLHVVRPREQVPLAVRPVRYVTATEATALTYAPWWVLIGALALFGLVQVVEVVVVRWITGEGTWWR